MVYCGSSNEAHTPSSTMTAYAQLYKSDKKEYGCIFLASGFLSFMHVAPGVYRQQYPGFCQSTPALTGILGAYKHTELWVILLW